MEFKTLNGYGAKDEVARKNIEALSRETGERINELSESFDRKMEQHDLAVEAVGETANAAAEATEKNADNIQNNTELIEKIMEDMKSEYRVTPQMFGAKGDGSTDDTDAIQAAIDSLPDGGGTVYFPAGTYMISRIITVGTGNGADKKSTKNAIKLVGASSNWSGSTIGVTLKPANHIGAILKVTGFINNVVIEGFQLMCNGMADFGIHITACQRSKFRNIEIFNPAFCGLGVIGGDAPTGNYNVYNDFEDILVTLYTLGSTGLCMDGNYSAQNDTWITSFDRCRFQAMEGAQNCTCARFLFVDSITFRRCHFTNYDTTGYGVEFNAIGHNTFPCGIGFYDCSISSTIVVESDTDKMRPCYFIGHGTHDNEVLPTNPKLIGVTDTGIPFNGWGNTAEEKVVAQAPILIYANADEPISVPNTGTWNYLLTIVNMNENIFTQGAGQAANGAVVYSETGVEKFLYCTKAD